MGAWRSSGCADAAKQHLNIPYNSFSFGGTGLHTLGYSPTRQAELIPPRPEIGAVINIREASKAHPASAEELVGVAASLLGSAGADRLGHFDQFPAPIYATDERGAIIYFNAASVEFSGRTPVVGDDHWCVSWKLRTDDGTPLPHDQCPMAVAVREGRPVRGIEAFAERPDGHRTRFRPYPTPAIDPNGQVVGAVNLLVPVDGDTGSKLRATADRCRTLAKWIDDRQANDALTRMAEECDQQAQILAPIEPAKARN